MITEREVDKFVSIFDFENWAALGLPDQLATRVMVVHDRKAGLTDVTILNKKLALDTHERLARWLKTHVDTYEIPRQ